MRPSRGRERISGAGAKVRHARGQISALRAPSGPSGPNGDGPKPVAAPGGGGHKLPGLPKRLGLGRSRPPKPGRIKKLRLAIIVVGLGASFALTRLLATMTFGVSIYDPLTYTVIAISLFTVALVACYLPARRAAKIDPMNALRQE